MDYQGLLSKMSSIVPYPQDKNISVSLKVMTMLSDNGEPIRLQDSSQRSIYC